MKKKYVVGGILGLCCALFLGEYRAQQFMIQVERGAECANKSILLERKILFSLYRKQKNNEELTPMEWNFLEKMAIKYHKRISRSLLAELYQDVVPLPIPFYKAQAALMTYDGWGQHASPFGTYHWDKGKYQKQHFSDLCEGALAFAYDIHTLSSFRVMRHVMVHSLERGVPVSMQKLLILVPAENPQERAYQKRLISYVKRFEL